MQDEEKILALLGVAAQQSGEQVTPERLQFTLDRLKLCPADKIIPALMGLAESARRFPTVSEIKEKAGLGELDAKDEGQLIAAKILQAISKFGEPPPGSTNVALNLKAYLGTKAWRVVEQSGGWSNVIKMAGDNLGTFKAQIRDLAQVVSKGDFYSLPTLPPGGSAEALKEKFSELDHLLPSIPAED